MMQCILFHQSNILIITDISTIQLWGDKNTICFGRNSAVYLGPNVFVTLWINGEKASERKWLTNVIVQNSSYWFMNLRNAPQLFDINARTCSAIYQTDDTGLYSVLFKWAQALRYNKAGVKVSWLWLYFCAADGQTENVKQHLGIRHGRVTPAPV